MLGKLFPPKWRHRNPAIRAEAVNLLRGDDPNLAEVIRRDADAGIRRIAVRRLEDLDLLFSVAADDIDESVRNAARRRVQQLLAGEEGSIPEEQAASRLNQQKDPELAEYLVRRSPSRQVRRLALTMLDKPSLLADIAMKDADGDIRLEALKAIDRLPTLERVAKEARGRDKRVARLAREMVDQLREQQERPGKQQQAVDRMETYAGLQQPDQTAVTRLLNAWEQLGSDAAGPLKQRFAQASAKAQQAIDDARKARENLDRQRAVCDQAGKLLADLERNAATPSFDLEGIGKIADLLRNSWQELEQELGELNGALATQLDETLDTLQRRAGEIDRHRKRHAQQLAVLGDMEQAATGDSPVGTARLKTIEKRWRDLPGKPDPGLARSFKQFLHQAQTRLEKSAERADELETEFSEHLKLLEKALDNGKLAPANTAMGKARKCHDELQQLAPQKLKSTKSTWSRLLGRLSELRDWQRFGSNTVREDLITAMQQLVDADLAVNERAKQVRDLRNQWRAVDRKGGSAPDALWKSFNAVAEEAFAPVIAHREQRQENQQQAAAERESFCDRLEQEYASIDWDNPDWHDIDTRVRKLRDQWRKLGGVDKESWKILNQRFLEAMKLFEEKLRAVRDSEKTRRERLIRQVERLAADPDLQTAIDETLAAQEKWKPLVTASRGVEQRLWKQFRAACDAVFERRKAKNDEFHRELDDNAGRKQAVIAEMQKLSELPAEERRKARGQRDRLMAEWREIGQVPKKKFKEITTAWNKALKAFDEAERRADIDQQNAYFDRLLEQTRALDALEHALCKGDAITLDNDFLAGFADRVQSLKSGDRTLCDAWKSNLEERNGMLLETEVVLEIESPAEFADQRRQWQLEHLSDAMTGGLSESPQQLAMQMLERACRTGAVPPEYDDSWRSRLEAIVSAMKQ